MRMLEGQNVITKIIIGQADKLSVQLPAVVAFLMHFCMKTSCLCFVPCQFHLTPVLNRPISSPVFIALVIHYLFAILQTSLCYL